MHRLSSRWHPTKSRLSAKKKKAQEMALKRWAKNKKDSVVAQMSPADETCGASSNFQDQSENRSVNVVVAGASEKKFSFASENLKPSSATSAQVKGDDTSFDAAYTIIKNTAWAQLLKGLNCTECGRETLGVVSQNRYGFCAKLEVQCASCGAVFGNAFTSDRASKNSQFDINAKMVEAFLSFGKGHSSLEKFSMCLGIHAMDKKTFAKCLLKLSEEGRNVRSEILQLSRKIVRQQHALLNSSVDENELLDISVSFDGTWHKRGHSSLYGIGIVIDVLTGLVVDYEILSKYCAECTTAARDLQVQSPEFAFWLKGHQDACDKNFSGSANAMEVHAAKLLWQRSILDCQMRYVTILSDGDSKTFQALQQLEVYGKDVTLEKEECINHIAKRMGTSLRKKVQEWKIKGVTLGGRKKGNLKEDIIIKLTNYYRQAIVNHAPNVDQMKTAIFASLYHCMSTNDKPQHNKCPKGPASWCFYNRALANGTVPASHTTMRTTLSESVVAKILPVYQRLAGDSLLQRCCSRTTQNANESLHSTIWANCPKEVFVCRKILEMAVMTAVSKFNMGTENFLNVKSGVTGTVVEQAALELASRRDTRRITQELKRKSPSYKAARCAKKFQKAAKNKKDQKQEGVTYSAGNF